MSNLRITDLSTGTVLLDGRTSCAFISWSDIFNRLCDSFQYSVEVEDKKVYSVAMAMIEVLEKNWDESGMVIATRLAEDGTVERVKYEVDASDKLCPSVHDDSPASEADAILRSIFG